MIIDAHTHILYDIDDGAKDISESLRLIQLEIENDVDIIVLTPHFDPYNDSAEIFTKKRREHYDILSQNIRDKNDKSDKNITLILGSETLYSPLLMYYSTLEPLCISGTRFILIEFVPDMKFGRAFFDEFNKLIIKFDIIPIIAHIERCNNIYNKVNIIKKFRQSGCVIQLNAGYIINNIGRKSVKRLFKHGYIDMVASDCHDSEKRPPNLKEAILLINEKYDGYYDKILSNKYKIASEYT